MSADIVDLGIVELPEWETAFSADGERLISREIGNSLSLIEATLVRKGLSETEAKRVTWYPCDYQEDRRAVLARRAGEHEKADGYRVLVMWPDGEEETSWGGPRATGAGFWTRTTSSRTCSRSASAKARSGGCSGKSLGRELTPPGPFS